MTMVEPWSRGAALLGEGRLAAARIAFWAQAQRAEAAADVVSLAEAALGLGGLWVHEHRATLDRARVGDLQRRALAALTALGELDAVGAPDRGSRSTGELAARLRARLAAEDSFVHGDPTAILAELDEIRRRGGPLALAEALSLAHHCHLGPQDAELRLALADELVAVAPATGRSVDAAMGLAWRTVDLVLAGDRRAGRSLRELRDGLARQRCDALGYLVAAMDVTAAMRAGDLAGAERAAEACLAQGTEVGDADAAGWYGAQLLAIRWMQGRTGELADLVGDLEQSSSVPEPTEAFTAAVAAVTAAACRREVAAGALARLRAGGLARIAPSSAWLTTMLAVCHAAFDLGDAEAAAEVYPLLAPFADRPVMASLGVACFGSAHQPLASGGVGQRRPRRCGRPPGRRRGRQPRGRGTGPPTRSPGRRWPTRSWPGAAPPTGPGLGREGSGHRRGSPTRPRPPGRGVGARRRPPAPARCRRRPGRPAAAPSRSVPAAGALRRSAAEAAAASAVVPVTCVRQGRAWLVRAGDRGATVRHSVGLAYLAELVANPGTAISAVDLASGHRLAAPRATPTRSSTPLLGPPTVGAWPSCGRRSTTPRPAPTSSGRRERGSSSTSSSTRSPPPPGSVGAAGGSRTTPNEPGWRCARPCPGRWPASWAWSRPSPPSSKPGS